MLAPRSRGSGSTERQQAAWLRLLVAHGGLGDAWISVDCLGGGPLMGPGCLEEANSVAIHSGLTMAGVSEGGESLIPSRTFVSNRKRRRAQPEFTLPPFSSGVTIEPNRR